MKAVAVMRVVFHKSITVTKIMSDYTRQVKLDLLEFRQHLFKAKNVDSLAVLERYLNNLFNMGRHSWITRLTLRIDIVIEPVFKKQLKVKFLVTSGCQEK